MKDRIEKLIKLEGYTASKFADLLGVQASNISHILSGRNKPSLDFIEKVLIKFPNVNPDWLIMGVGDVYRSNIDDISVEKSHTYIVTGVKNNTLFPEELDYTCKQNVAEEEIISPEPQLETLKMHQTLNVQSNDVQQDVHTPQNIITDSDIDRIVIFYKDKTFVSYRP